MKKNFYRLIDGNYRTVTSYQGTKSNANAYFKRFIQKVSPCTGLAFPMYVYTYSSYADMLAGTCIRSVTELH